MAARETSMPWSPPKNPVWGLTAKVGPWKSTPKDLKEFNSRAGGPHAGHGNWMQTFNPKPYIQTMPTPGLPNYVTKDVVVSEDFDVPRGIKIPGINKMGSKGASGSRYLGDNLVSKFGLRGSEPQNGAQGNGRENVKVNNPIDKSMPARKIYKSIGDVFESIHKKKTAGRNESDTLASIINQMSKDKGKRKASLPRPTEPKTGLFINVPKYSHHGSSSGLSLNERKEIKTHITPPPRPPVPIDVDVNLKLKTRPKAGDKRKNSLSVVSAAKKEKEGT